jgi:hypothetical protein
VLIDRASEVGGVWRDNDYPGAAVEIPSHLYSLSFAPNPDWHNTYAKRIELYAYLKRVTDEFGLRRHLVLDCAVERLDWDPVEQLWRLETGSGQRTATHVVLATGALADPVIPALPGLEQFAGEPVGVGFTDHGRGIIAYDVALFERQRPVSDTGYWSQRVSDVAQMTPQWMKALAPLAETCRAAITARPRLGAEDAGS